MSAFAPHQTYFTPTISRPNEVGKYFVVRGPSGQIICEFEREQDARAFVSSNAFSLRLTAKRTSGVIQA